MGHRRVLGLVPGAKAGRHDSRHQPVAGAPREGTTLTALERRRPERCTQSLLGRGSPGPSLGGRSVLSREGRVVTMLPQVGVETLRKVRRLPVTFPHGPHRGSYGWG
jgi:hypothetical protein